MRHFMAQFGPALKWPWTKLTDVPELTDELLDTIVEQSDEQAGALSARELEQLRDDCLVSVLQALRGRDIGAGAVLARHERALSAAARPRVIADGDDLAQPLALHTAQVAPDWVDYNGHAHESRYLQVFGDASDALFAYLGIDDAYLATGSYFTVESHLSHLREALLDDRLAVATQVLDCDARRLHVFHSLTREADGELLATAEQLFLHVDTVARRAAPASAVVLARVQRIAEAHAALPRPDRAGRSIGIPGAVADALDRAGVDLGEPPGRRGRFAARALHVAVGAGRHDHHVDVTEPSGARRAHPAARADVLGPPAVRAATRDLDRDDVRAAVARAAAREARQVVRVDHLTAAHAVQRRQRLERGGAGLGREGGEREHQTDDYERVAGHGVPRDGDRGSRCRTGFRAVLTT